MDINLIRTFVEVIQAGNFIRAAERLRVTQSTVSMRVKALEDDLGRQLFTRNKTGTALTPAGHQFRRHAETMLRLWQQARQDVALPQKFRAALVVGAQYSLWERLLLRWLPRMRAAASDVMLQAEIGTSAELMAHVAGGLIDIAVLYDPRPRPGLVIEKLLEEQFVLVSADAAVATRGVAHSGEPAKGYVLVDWGSEFRRQHSEAFPDFETPAVVLSIGALGLSYILENGGAAYFPKRLVRQQMVEGRLHEVIKAPQFYRPAYMVYPAYEPRAEWLEAALEGMRAVAAQEHET